MRLNTLFAGLFTMLSVLGCVGSGAEEQPAGPGRGDSPIPQEEPGEPSEITTDAPVYVPEEIQQEPVTEMEELPPPPVPIEKDQVRPPAKPPTSQDKPVYEPMDPSRKPTNPRPKPTQPSVITTESPTPVEELQELEIVENNRTDTSALAPEIETGTDQKTDKPGFAGLRGATASYECERDMKLDSVHRVELVISKSMDTVMILSRASSFENPENIEHEAVEIGDYVSAQLIDPSNGANFQISELSLEKQRITQRDTFSYLWQWDVTPLQTGNLPLRLKVITELEGEMRDIPVFDTQIRVKSEEAPPRPWWIIPSGLAVVLGLGTLLYFKRGKRKISKALPLPADLVQEVRVLVSDGDTLEALNLLESRLASTHPGVLDEVLLLKANYNKTKRKLSLNQISQEAAGIEYSKVHTGILELLKV